MNLNRHGTRHSRFPRLVDLCCVWTVSCGFPSGRLVRDTAQLSNKRIPLQGSRTLRVRALSASDVHRTLSVLACFFSSILWQSTKCQKQTGVGLFNFIFTQINSEMYCITMHKSTESRAQELDNRRKLETQNLNVASQRAIARRGTTPRGYSPRMWVGVCRTVLKPLTLFQTKSSRPGFPYPFSDHLKRLLIALSKPMNFCRGLFSFSITSFSKTVHAG